MAQRRMAMAAMILACVIWGVSGIYFHALTGVPAGELLAHRVLWSLALFAAILGATGRLGLVLRALRSPLLPRLVLAALAISANWLIFIISVLSNHFVQASLGYYIFPLMSVLVGVVLFGERMMRVQALAVGLAALAVAILTWGLGVAPWLSLAIAATFAVYGAAKKGLDLPPIVSVTAELAILAPIAALWLILRPETAGIAAPPPLMGQGWQPLLLVGTCLLTAVPLMLFSQAARLLDLATVGLLQYLNPTIQFLVATLWFREPFTRWHVAAFALIWLALALYSGAALRRGRRGLPGRAARL